eukprot:765281-Hanusia_phi.AAC.5
MAMKRVRGLEIACWYRQTTSALCVCDSLTGDEASECQRDSGESESFSARGRQLVRYTSLTLLGRKSEDPDSVACQLASSPYFWNEPLKVSPGICFILNVLSGDIFLERFPLTGSVVSMAREQERMTTEGKTSEEEGRRKGGGERMERT